MKSILQSIKPQYCELIASGKKTIEVRKTKPKLQTPFKCYVYCTKDKIPFLLPTYSKGNLTESDIWQNGNGKVIGEYVCDEIINLFALSKFWFPDEILSATCLTPDEIKKYANGAEKLYGWHITNAKLYDKPRKLSSFYKSCNYNVYGNCYLRNMLSCGYQDIDEYSGLRVCGNTLTRSPQSFCYVEEAEDAD